MLAIRHNKIIPTTTTTKINEGLINLESSKNEINHHSSTTAIIFNFSPRLVLPDLPPGSGGEKVNWNNEIDLTLSQSKKHPLSVFLGAWKGKDINEMLDMVYKTRSKF